MNALNNTTMNFLRIIRNIGMMCTVLVVLIGNQSFINDDSVNFNDTTQSKRLLTTSGADTNNVAVKSNIPGNEGENVKIIFTNLNTEALDADIYLDFQRKNRILNFDFIRNSGNQVETEVNNHFLGENETIAAWQSGTAASDEEALRNFEKANPFTISFSWDASVDNEIRSRFEKENQSAKITLNCLSAENLAATDLAVMEQFTAACQ